MHRLDPAAAEPAVLTTLAVPAQRASAWVVETDPADAERWLAGLALADSNQTAQQLYQALFTLNRMEVDPDDRVRIMELYRQPLAITVANLQAHFTNFALPLRPRLKQLADFLRQLHMEMAYGYKHVLAAAADEHKPWENDAVLLAVARTIDSLGEVLLRSYQVYMPAPSGVWKEIHALYHFVERHDRQNDSLAAFNDGRELNVTLTYLQVLMLGLCGPYQLPRNEVHRVRAFLNRWAGRATIGAQLDAVDPTGHFLLDLDADHPAVPFPRDVPLHSAAALRAVNAIELARAVHGFTVRLQKGEAPSSLELGFECVGADCVDTLKRMLRFWGMAGRRQFSRHQRKQPLSLCVGLNALHFFASGQRPFTEPRPVTPSLELGAQAPSRADLEAEARTAPAASEVTELFRIDSRWQIKDESAGGLSLLRIGELGPQMRIGDLIGIHNPALDQWRVGVVRWIKSPDTQRVEMGVEMLAPSAHPLAMAPAGVRDAPAMPALLLPSVEALRQPASLIVARGACQRGDDINLFDDGSPPRRVRVLNVVERTNAFSQVVFADSVAPDS